MKDSNLIFSRTKSLLRCALLGKSIDDSLFASMQAEDWNELMDYFNKQGIFAITLSAIANSSVRPPRKELLKWIGQANVLENRFKEQADIVRKLTKFFNKNGIDVLIMKGLALSSYYTKPESREFCDIDIYTFGDNKKANNLIRKRGIKIEEEDKHDIFDIGGVHFEHHKTFLSVDFSIGRTLENHLLEICSQNIFLRSNDNWIIPNADFNAIFLLRHMTRHLASEGCTLKNVLDYGLLLYKDGDNINWGKIVPILKETKLDKAFDTIVTICGKVLDEDFTRFYIQKPNTELVKRVFNEILNVDIFADRDSDINKRVIKKTKRLFSRKWMYDTQLLPDKFWSEVIWGSIRDHIRKPDYL